MQASFKRTAKQEEALSVLGGPATHCMLFGGSRSGKTFEIIEAIICRALAAAGSRHAILRFRFNHCKASIVHDTFPKVMRLCFPQVSYHLDKSDWFAQFENGSQIWFGGLDDKERTEKILGQEYATIFLNECSQIPYSSRNIAITRLAQNVMCEELGRPLRNKMYYDENPPSKGHWTHKLFIEHKDPDTKRLINGADYACLLMNPEDNKENLPEGYLETLDSLPIRMQKRFKLGLFSDNTDNALWTEEIIEKWRSIDIDLPDMQRVVVAVDPSGSDDEEQSDNDEIGIVVAGLGDDGNGYLLEDLTKRCGPAKWGKIATSAYDRHKADRIVGEVNYGGEMVKFVVQTAKPNVPFKKLNASRGKVVRAEPISSLHEQGKIRFVGFFPELEDELLNFTTTGYTGEDSPNRADSMVWAFSELFPGLVEEAKKKEQKKSKPPVVRRSAQSWMG